MPAEFDWCRKQSGSHIITIKHGKDKYQHICYFKGKSYPGEVKTKQSDSKDSKK